MDDCLVCERPTAYPDNGVCPFCMHAASQALLTATDICHETIFRSWMNNEVSYHLYLDSNSYVVEHIAVQAHYETLRDLDVQDYLISVLNEILETLAIDVIHHVNSDQFLWDYGVCIFKDDMLIFGKTTLDLMVERGYLRKEIDRLGAVYTLANLDAYIEQIRGIALRIANTEVIAAQSETRKRWAEMHVVRAEIGRIPNIHIYED